MATNALTLCLLLLLLFSFSLSSVEAQTEKTATALYVFGDSTVDAGNNIHLETPAQANHLPYGIDFNNTPTGRFTNGKTTADFLAIFLGLPLVPPYLGLSEDERIYLTTGINYASGGCGILPETGKFIAKDCLTFDKQIDFLKVLSKMIYPTSFRTQRSFYSTYQRQFFSSLLGEMIMLSITFLLERVHGAVFRLKTFQISSSMNSPSALRYEYMIRRLYELGARKFLVNNIGPMGCLPHISRGGECNETVNQMILPFSDNLSRMLEELQSTSLCEAQFSNPNNFRFLAEVKENQEENGIINTKDPCWPQNSTTLSENRDQYFFFDGVHTTQASNYLFSVDCFNGTLCSPQNVEGLMRA
ncbi:hypothetical protein F0562_033042 [Nyssa sinensis]|uniref:GDSL esterase/lipase n=1 Tax=Nyssa sinensis TaxID=561372 RepID=A0A5J5AUZ4_9ASTE|nr:hypothetical protein F0562_033042 [Nyssa sinensis]